MRPAVEDVRKGKSLAGCLGRSVEVLADEADRSGVGVVDPLAIGAGQAHPHS